MGTSPAVQWLTLPSNAGGAGLIPGRGTKIPHAEGCGQKLKKKRKITRYHYIPTQMVKP